MHKMNVPVVFIECASALEQCISKLLSRPEIAVDLEFDKNYYRFGFNLCLMQIYDGNTCYLVDPLSRNLQISRLFPVFENSSITKVCFSFDEDLRLLHSLGCFPKNLYDLDIASRLLNYPAMSLSNLLIEILSLDPGASSQQSNWYRRPLSERQKNYAASDVIYLPELKNSLSSMAAEKNVTEWIEEENRHLDSLDYSEVMNNHLIKEKDKCGFNEIEWHIYKKLIYWRHDLAKKYNKPDYQLICKKSLIHMAKNALMDTDWLNIPGVFKKIKTEFYAAQMNRLLKEARKEAIQLGYDESESARKPLTKEEHQKMLIAKKDISRLKRIYFEPVKEKISDRYGTETANYILSNRIIADIVTGQNGQLKKYKRDLICNCARELGLKTDTIDEIIQKNCA